MASPVKHCVVQTPQANDMTFNTTANQTGTLPATGYIRQDKLIGTPARKATDTLPAHEATQGIVPFSSATLWRKVKSGDFPKPVKLSERVTAWSVESIRAWMMSKGGAQ
jgi:prophage regulatory protein